MSVNLLLTGPDPESVQSLASLLAEHPDMEIFDSQIASVLIGKNGLNDLYRALQKSYHVNRMSKKIRQFRTHARLYLSVKELSELDIFLNRITAVEYEGMPFCDRSELNPLQTILFERKRRKAKAMKRKPKMGSMYIPVDISSFISSCRDFLDQLIRKRTDHSVKYKLIKLDGTHSVPLSISEIFSVSKIIYIIHDPRNLFSIFKKSKDPWLGKNPKNFCHWFKSTNRLLKGNAADSTTTYKLSYEELIEDQENAINNLFNFLDIDCTLSDSLRINSEHDSVDWYKKVLTDSELRIFEHHFSNFLNP